METEDYCQTIDDPRHRKLILTLDLKKEFTIHVILKVLSKMTFSIIMNLLEKFNVRYTSLNHNFKLLHSIHTNNEKAF